MVVEIDDDIVGHRRLQVVKLPDQTLFSQSKSSFGRDDDFGSVYRNRLNRYAAFVNRPLPCRSGREQIDETVVKVIGIIGKPSYSM